MKEHTIKIVDGGAVEYIHDTTLAAALDDLGPAKITRASHVEPHPSRPGWVADMRPSGGPILGAKTTFMRVSHTAAAVPVDQLGRSLDALVPFATREDALAAEVAWLKREKGL